MLVYFTDNLVQPGYSNFDFKSRRDSRKSIFGYVFSLGGGTVYQRSVKQSSNADSIIEAKYMATSKVAKEAAWLKKFLEELEVVPSA